MPETDSIETERLPQSLARMRALHRPADDLIRSIYEKRVAWSARRTAYQEKMRCAYAVTKDDDFAAAAWQRLINHLGPATPLLAVEPAIPLLGPQPGNTCFDALLMLALRYTDWRRSPEEWTPQSPDARRQFRSLARHLLAHYPVPAFMDAVWFEGFTEEGERHRDWFAHIGSGHNIRRAELPLCLTEKAAHYFLQAPDDVSITAALRWGQTFALGGDEHLARALSESRLRTILPDEPFWESVIHFCVKNLGSHVTRIGPIVDYIYGQRFGEAADFSDAPDPGFVMKGRTAAALQRRVDEWHEQLAREAKRPRSSWQPTGLEGLQTEERDSNRALYTWTVVELLDSRALQEEGREMRHCVFSYAAACVNGTTSIWSLRARGAREPRAHRLLTVEVNNARRAIVQVRGRCNQSSASFHGNEHMRTGIVLLRRWAQQQKLSIACGL